MTWTPRFTSSLIFSGCKSYLNHFSKLSVLEHRCLIPVALVQECRNLLKVLEQSKHLIVLPSMSETRIMW